MSRSESTPDGGADAAMPAITRSLAAAAVTAALVAALAACGGDGDHNPPPPPAESSESAEPETPPETSDTGEGSTAPEDQDSDNSVFLGESSADSKGKVEVPTSNVGEAASQDVRFVNNGNESKTFREFSASTGSGEASITADNCSGVELPPGGSCTVTLQHVADQPGGYSGELTALTSDGEAFTAEITGEATSTPEVSETPTPDTGETPDEGKRPTG
ncbi:hypothetical protein ABZ924_27405 [Streptomyces sp. NPDC046876]|uniref:hypothetical protein n=1 Tax=Streptomyces sp. NPDC046876 TaxID=3155616 RepID=UPI0033FBC7ED